MRPVSSAAGCGWYIAVMFSAATACGQMYVGHDGYPSAPAQWQSAPREWSPYAPGMVAGIASHQPTYTGVPQPRPLQHAPTPETGSHPAAPSGGTGLLTYGEAGCSSCFPPPTVSECIESCVPPACGAGPVWTLRGGALFLFQDNENYRTFSYDSAIETDQRLDWHEMDPDLMPGFEIGATRFDCCAMTGWEGLYWGLFPAETTASALATDVTGNLDPILDFSQLDYAGNPANAFTNAAVLHRLRRTSEFHNVEVNRLWGVATGCGWSPWRVRTLAGFRYFRFEEGLQFAADTNDAVLTGEPDELYYTVDVDNNLYGLQIGGVVERRLQGRWGLMAGAKAGVFGNDASARSRIGGAAGLALVNNGPNAGRAWDINADKQDVAFLAEVQAGLTCQLGARWKAVGQYRVLSASGVALPGNQIYHDLRGVNDVERLSTNGSLFLHGVFVGAEREF